MAGKAAKTQRLGTHDWLAGALETLGREGVIGVRVENLARSMGVTKGSFYHHFKDKEELINRLREHWESEMTDKIDAHLSHLHGKPAQQLLAFLEVIAKTNRYDAAMRAWALHDERVATAVRRVDRKRLKYVRDLFLRMGFPADQAEMRSRMSYCYVVGECTTLAEETTLKSRLEDIRLRHEFLTGWRATVTGSPS